MSSELEKRQNSEKRKPKNPIKFNITLNEEQKVAKSEILNNTVTLLKGQAGSGKCIHGDTELLVQVDEEFYNFLIDKNYVKKD